MSAINSEPSLGLSVTTSDSSAAGSKGSKSKGGGKFKQSLGNFFQNKKRRKWLIVAAVAIVAVIGVRYFIFGGAAVVQGAEEFTEQPVSRRNIVSTLSGSGSLEPADAYTISTLVEGDILSAPFEEGDVVEKDALLYEIDSSDVSTTLERAELSLENSQRNYSRQLENRSDLSVTADEAGTVVTIDVEVGDEVNAGQALGTIRNQSVMSVTMPFASDDAQRLSLGQTAQVTIDGSFETITGTISKISAADEVLGGGMLIRQVTIDVNNPGGIAGGQSATATVGEIACNGSGSFEFKAEATITAATSGKVARINAPEGTFVYKGQTIITLSSTTLDDAVESASNSLRDAQLSYENSYKQVNDYTVTSPIAGTIVEKFYKEGDTLESGKTLCTIFDLSYLTMSLNVDELDIANVEVGQPVTITADAVSGRVYVGEVTKININGTTANGVTYYPVTIRIDETDGLLPGMNVDAEIITQRAEDVLAVPSGAIARGNRVLVKTEGAASDDGAPEGFEYRSVEIGVSDDSFTQILDGLAEGDIVAVYDTTGEMAMNYMMMGGGMQGGGMVVMEAGPGGGGPGGGF